MQKEAQFYKKLKFKTVQCMLCPHFCVIKENEFGKCKARKNKEGKLYSIVYGNAVSLGVDPIEKKPFYHFLPGSTAYSIGTTGCNLKCKWCQNSIISQAYPEEIESLALLPEKIVENAIKENCSTIAYTYTEPTIFYEYALETAKIAKEKGLKNVIVTNGFINRKPAKELFKYIDGANVDLKAFNEETYKNYCNARLQSILDTLKLLKRMKVWIEITNLIVPGINDDLKEIREMCIWIKKNLGTWFPLHFSRFFPHYKILRKRPTPMNVLKKAYIIAKRVGMKNVYLGNVIEENNYTDTYCLKCKRGIIKRSNYEIKEIHLKGNKCSYCGRRIKGVWK